MKAFRFIIPLLILASVFIGLFAKSPQKGFAFTNAQAAIVTPVGPTGTNWTMTFNDEFDGTSLNRNAWRSDYFPNGGNGEMQQYVSDNSHNNYLVQNGNLQIIARKETLNGQSFTSGIIHTKGLFEQKYGFYEIRAKVPYGKGFWPAFWLLPNQDNWVPEIDVSEILSDKPSINYMTYHYYNSTGAYVQTQSQNTGTDYSVGWHTFAIDWEANAMVWYVDGIEQKRVTDTSIIPNMPLYVIANLAVGGNWPGSPDASTVFPSTFNIDYIRVWQKSGSSPTLAPTNPAPTSTPTKAAPTATPTKAPPSSTPVPTGNMISNASFEETSSSPWNTPWGFRNDLGATFSQDTTTTATNNSRASLKAFLPTSSSTQPWVVSVSQSNNTLSAGQSYTLSFWAKASATRPVRAVIQEQNSPYTVYSNQTANLTSTWTRYTFAFTTLNMTTSAMFNINLADAKGSVWIDEVSLCRTGLVCSSTVIFLPTVTATSAVSPTVLLPSSIPTKTATLMPTGVPPIVTSTPISIENMISNASFEDANVSPWNTPWSFRNDLHATLSQDTTTVANSSRASLKASLPTSSSTQPWVVSVSQPNKTLSAGQSYTLSFWAKASAIRPVRAVIQGQNSPYTVYTNQTANLTGTWTRFTFAFTAPSSTTTAMFNINLADAIGSVWIDEVSMCRTGLVCK